jgi:hypothetical protein
MTNYIQTKNGKTTDGKNGGIFKGVRHSSLEGGIPIKIEGGGSALVEDSEPIIIPEAVNNPKKHLFDGKQMTSKEILSEINTRYKGVPIKKKGGLLKKEKGGFVNKKAISVKSGSVIITRNAALDNKKKHNFNGEQLTNKEVLSKINEGGGGVSFGDGGKLEDKEVEGNTKKIDSYTDKLNKYIEEAGYFTYISHSRTNFGNSNYIIVSNKADEYGIPSGNEKKIRISDHGVSNYDRIFNEIHIGFNYNDNPSKEDIQRTINYVLKELRWKFNKSEYFHKEDGLEEKKAYNVQTPIVGENDVITKEYLSKKGRQLYEVTRTYINPVIKWVYNEDGKVFYTESKFELGGNVGKNKLTTALSILKQTDVPFLFQSAKEDNPEELIKYIAEQGQGLHSDDKESLYKVTVNVFGKDLTDASIEAYLIKESGGIIDCGCNHEKGGTIEDMVICQNCGHELETKGKNPNYKYLCFKCTYNNEKHYK